MKKTNTSTNIINYSFPAWKIGTYNAKNPRTRKRYADTMEDFSLVQKSVIVVETSIKN